MRIIIKLEVPDESMGHLKFLMAAMIAPLNTQPLGITK
jgi:hypothetical protein